MHRAREQRCFHLPAGVTLGNNSMEELIDRSDWNVIVYVSLR